jgi:hypothetical protein
VSRGGAASLAALLAVVAASGCGETERLPPPPAASHDRVALEVSFDRDGDGPAEQLTTRLQCPSPQHEEACRRALRLPPSAFDPVPGDVACTEIYGGPQQGRIEGTIGRRRVEGVFTRANGCQIARYDRVAFLLELAR